MSLASGVRLGPYEVVAPVGAGGMGEVYRAKDTKLGRDVALKILPEAFATDPDRLARFKREAQVLASLNHPNIGAIHGLEEANGVTALVMELVEGEELAQRISRGALPLDETLPIARQIAQALEAAHEQGIIHRDLKPANIKLRPDGTVKVLDFGLAKALEPVSAGGTDVTASPTITTPAMTRMGVLLGTAAYMSPEQAKGHAADRRSDVWAFGCVLYEMLSGHAAFNGDTISEIIASVLRDEPDWQRLPVDTPDGIRRLLRRCLQKDRRQRLRDIGDARIELDEAPGVPQTVRSGASRVSRRLERLSWVAAITAIILAAVISFFWGRQAPASPAEARVEITTPPPSDPVSFAISPDGQKLVFAATVDGRARLWLRVLDTLSLRSLAGTDDARLPFWSPDSQSIAFFADGSLKRIDIDGGFVQALAKANPGSGGSWSSDEQILFAPSNDGPVFRIPATGGEPVMMTHVSRPGQTAHRLPQFLPDGRHFLYYASGSPEARGVYVGRLDRPESHRVLDADAAAVYAPSGHLLFVRQGTLVAQAFDPTSVALLGNPFAVAEPGAPVVFQSVAALSTSMAGHVVYRGGSREGQNQFIWFDRSGKELATLGPDGDFMNSPMMSPDGRFVALTRAINGNADVWLLETARGVLRRFTSDIVNDIQPVWSPDGSRIVFGSNRKGEFDLYEKSATGTESERLLLGKPGSEVATDWSPDGRFLLYRINDPKTRYDIWAMTMDGTTKTFPVVETSFDERDGQFSPDGKWIAYQSNESGQFEIYVQEFPGPAERTPVSTTGGAQVRWRRDGKELFYIALDGRLMAVPLELAAGSRTVDVGTPVPLFTTRVGGAFSNPLNRQQYMVSDDGQRFLMNTVSAENTPPMTLILNWKPKPS